MNTEVPVLPKAVWQTALQNTLWWLMWNHFYGLNFKRWLALVQITEFWHIEKLFLCRIETWYITHQFFCCKLVPDLLLSPCVSEASIFLIFILPFLMKFWKNMKLAIVMMQHKPNLLYIPELMGIKLPSVQNWTQHQLWFDLVRKVSAVDVRVKRSMVNSCFLSCGGTAKEFFSVSQALGFHSVGWLVADRHRVKPDGPLCSHEKNTKG